MTIQDEKRNMLHALVPRDSQVKIHISHGKKVAKMMALRKGIVEKTAMSKAGERAI